MDTYEDFLEHHGIRGMKWGVRRDERRLSEADQALNISQRSKVRVASTISALAAMGMASNAAATLFQLQSRFEHLRILREVQKYAENSPYIDDAGREAIRQTRSHIIKGLVGSAIGATAIATAVGIVTRRTAKAYFAPLHKVYGDVKPKINRDLKDLSRDIKKGKRPKLTNKQYEAEVASIVAKHMTKDVANALQPFHELARAQLGTELNTKNLKITFEKLPNTNLVSKMTVTTPTGLKLVKAVKNVEHAASDDTDAPDLELFFDYKFDSDGYITEWSCPTIEIANDLFEGRFDMAEISKTYDPKSNLQHIDTFDDFLEHHGIRGMKWGVRKGSLGVADLGTGRGVGALNEPGKGPASRKEVESASAAAQKVAQAMLHKETGALGPTGEVTKLNARYAAQHPGKMKGKVLEAYDKDVASALTQAARKHVPKGADALVVVDSSSIHLFVGSKETVDKFKDSMKHSDMTEVAFDIQRDESGFIVDVDARSKTIEHSDFDAFLAHHGIKGMKWGVRRDRPSGGARRTATTTTDRALQPTNHSISPKVEGEHHLSKKLAAKIVTPKEVSDDAAHHKELLTKVRTHGISSLSNQELKKFHERLDMEKKFSKFQEEQRAKKNSRVKKIMNKVMDQMAERALTTVAGHVVDKHTEKFIKGKTVAKLLPKP